MQNQESKSKSEDAKQPSGGSRLDATPCSHDYHKFVRKGRARYHCRKCDADISLDVTLIAVADMESENSQDQSPQGG